MSNLKKNQDKPIQYYKNIRIMADFDLHEKISEIVQGILRPGSRILDYGSGEGALSQRLSDCGYQVVSVDINKEKFKANTKFEEINFNCRDDVQLFIRRYNNHFDMVLGVEVIEHVENPWEYIRDLKELVKQHGFIIITTPNVTSWYSRVNFLFKGRLHQFEDSDLSYGHINPIFQNEIKLICDENGLSIEKFEPAGRIPIIRISLSIKRTILTIFGIFFYPLMQGFKDGWCVITLIRKP